VCDELSLYHIPKFKVITYRCPALAVMAVNSETVLVSCLDNTLRIYKVHGNQLRLLATVPHKKCAMWTSCLYPYRDAGYVLASMELWATGVDISVTSSRFNQYRVQEVTKILFNSKVLPFCEDVSKIILRYLCL